VIVVNNAAARAARGASSVTPIVFVSGASYWRVIGSDSVTGLAITTRPTRGLNHI
jgi:hypothetical protein